MELPALADEGEEGGRGWEGGTEGGAPICSGEEGTLMGTFDVIVVSEPDGAAAGWYALAALGCYKDPPHQVDHATRRDVSTTIMSFKGSL